MKPPSRPLFLARRIYRERRLMDAARILPVAGAFLVLLPLLWQSRPAGAEGPGTAAVGLYLFAVWAGLIIVALLMSRRLRRIGDSGLASGDTPPARPRDGAEQKGGAGG